MAGGLGSDALGIQTFCANHAVTREALRAGLRRRMQALLLEEIPRPTLEQHAAIPEHSTFEENQGSRVGAKTTEHGFDPGETGGRRLAVVMPQYTRT